MVLFDTILLEIKHSFSYEYNLKSFNRGWSFKVTLVLPVTSSRSDKFLEKIILNLQRVYFSWGYMF